MKKRRKKHLRTNYNFPIILALIALFIGLVSLLVFKNRPISCANSLSCQESLKFRIEENAVAIFNNQKFSVPEIDFTQNIIEPLVLGSKDSAAGKHIYVNLATQTLSAYEGKTLIMQTPISSGLWGKTPTGEFTIWVKLRSTVMSGGSGDDYYYLPNVPYVMFFANSEVPESAGFSLHGTYWHNNFGHPMSHGCVNMKTTDIAKLYEWADPVTSGDITYSDNENLGTKITIYNGSDI